MSHMLVDSFAAVIEQIEPETLDACERAAPLLLASINERMGQREDLSDLIGPNPREVMEQNHANALRFVLEQIRLKSAQALIQGIVWAYRTYTSKGFSYGYFPIEVETWKIVVEHHLAAPYAEQLAALYELMLQHHRSFLVLSQVKQQNAQVDEALVSYFQRYMDALLAPDIHAALEVSREYIQTVWDIPTWWEQIILPSMYEIGRLWAEGQITIGQEHIATSITQRVMSVFYPLILELPRDKGTIVVTVSPNELHEVGARMLADLLEIHGWDVYYTGANTPEEGLFELLETRQAKVLCISTTMNSHLGTVGKIIHRLRAGAREQRPHILVGGQAYMADADLWKKVGADGFVISASQAVAYLQSQLLNGHPPPTNPALN